MPFRAGQEPVTAHRDGAGTVGAQPAPVARVERTGGQGEHVFQVGGEQIGQVLVLAIMNPAGQRVALCEPCLAQRMVALGRRQGNHQVAAHEPDRVGHTAFLVARIRVAEPCLEPVMSHHHRKQTRERDTAVRLAPAHARGIDRTPTARALRRYARRPAASRHTRIQLPRQATRPRSAYSNTADSRPGNAPRAPRRQPTRRPDRNQPAPMRAAIPVRRNRPARHDVPRASA